LASLLQIAAALALAAPALYPAPPDLLVLVNDRDPTSRSVGEYYARRRSIPASHVVRFQTATSEEIDRKTFELEIRAPLLQALARRGSLPRYLVLCQGMPLKIRGLGDKMRTDAASVDSELAALKLELQSGRKIALPGSLPNPWFGAQPGGPPPIFLVTRLAGFTFADIRGLIDRSIAADQQPASRGRVVIDQHEPGIDSDGNLWLYRAARQFPEARLVLDETSKVITGVQGVIAYAAWGSNDRSRRRELQGRRDLGLRFLPGAIATEFVSTNGRSFHEPPPQWRFGEWDTVTAYFEGTPQSLTGDLVRAGVTGASGHVYEPFLHLTPRPDILLPAYLLQGATLGEAFWQSIPAVSWMNIVVGDPLCRLR
jgi:uncharacterized protein (TIGR03790 family)